MLTLSGNLVPSWFTSFVNKDAIKEFVSVVFTTDQREPHEESVIEVSAVRFYKGVPVGVFHSLSNPGSIAKLKDIVVKRTLITEDELASASREARVIWGFTEFLGASPLVGYKVFEQQEILDRMTSRNTHSSIGYHLIDLYSLLRGTQENFDEGVTARGLPNYTGHVLTASDTELARKIPSLLDALHIGYTFAHIANNNPTAVTQNTRTRPNKLSHASITPHPMSHAGRGELKSTTFYGNVTISGLTDEFPTQLQTVQTVVDNGGNFSKENPRLHIAGSLSREGELTAPRDSSERTLREARILVSQGGVEVMTGSEANEYTQKRLRAYEGHPAELTFGAPPTTLQQELASESEAVTAARQHKEDHGLTWERLKERTAAMDPQLRVDSVANFEATPRGKLALKRRKEEEQKDKRLAFYKKHRLIHFFLPQEEIYSVWSLITTLVLVFIPGLLPLAMIRLGNKWLALLSFISGVTFMYALSNESWATAGYFMMLLYFALIPLGAVSVVANIIRYYKGDYEDSYDKRMRAATVAQRRREGQVSYIREML